ncbi:MAG: transport channel protein, partial [Methanosarcinaceae archaeon]|nr:transport channel protein [Methanosarcinaceae archaeon]
RSSGTIVLAEVSLGYDIPRTQVKEVLLRAAEKCDLQEPFVHVRQLGDFSVVYRVSGLLSEVKQLLSTRSRLKECVLDELHAGGIEIVSPSFMNTRQISPDVKFIPKVMIERLPAKDEPVPEDIVFDKAEEAESLEKLHERHAKLQKEIEELKSSLSDEYDEALRIQIQKKIDLLKARSTRLIEYIKQRDGGEK